jgi:cytochrome bd-type quinol oxidase subunit 2
VAIGCPESGKEAAMSENQVTAPAMQTNSLAIAAFVLSIMGMYASPVLSGVLALVAIRQVKQRGQHGFAFAVTALAVAAAVTALHVAMWIECGHPNFDLMTTAHW